MNHAQALELFRSRPTAELLSERDIAATFVDPSGIVRFWLQEYLHGFVDAGAGKVKFVKGRTGTGKTHLLRELHLLSTETRYLSVFLSGYVDKLAAIDDLYRAVSKHIDWHAILDKCAVSLIQQQLGYQDYQLPVDQFREWAEQTQGRSQMSLMTDIREASDRFVRDLDVYAAFREPLRASLMRRLGSDRTDELRLIQWLQGERLKKAERRSIGLPTNVDKRNARAMLLSLAALARVAGYQGLVILVDGTEVMAATQRQEGLPYYTRAARDQAYEMIRQLIDESHHAPHLFVVFAGNEALFENQKTGIGAYPALWNRIQPEIVTAQINRFADIADLDKLWCAEDLQEITEIWREKKDSVELTGEPGAPMRAARSLDWARVRRSVSTALGSMNGGV